MRQYRAADGVQTKNKTYFGRLDYLTVVLNGNRLSHQDVTGTSQSVKGVRVGECACV